MIEKDKLGERTLYAERHKLASLQGNRFSSLSSYLIRATGVALASFEYRDSNPASSTEVTR